MDGNLKSVKVYLLVALGAACLTFLWFDKMDQSTFMGVMTPTFIAWLAAHATQQVTKLRNGGSGD